MIKVETPHACTNCLICELACSFHHIRKFSRSRSSIRVNKSLFDPEKTPEIIVFYDKTQGDPVCDLCDNEPSPFCVRLCPENVLKIERSLS